MRVSNGYHPILLAMNHDNRANNTSNIEARPAVSWAIGDTIVGITNDTLFEWSVVRI